MNMAGTETDVSRGRNALGVGPSQQLPKTKELRHGVWNYHLLCAEVPSATHNGVG